MVYWWLYINRSGKKNRNRPELVKPTVRSRPVTHGRARTIGELYRRLSIGSTWSVSENYEKHLQNIMTFAIFQTGYSNRFVVVFDEFRLILDIA